VRVTVNVIPSSSPSNALNLSAVIDNVGCFPESITQMLPFRDSPKNHIFFAKTKIFHTIGIKKASSDHLVKSWYHTFGLPIAVTNCSNNYGPYHFPEKLIPLVILNALERKPLPVYGKGENIRDWLYVEDHAKAITLVFQKGRAGETYNIGGRNERTNIDVVKTICQVLDELKPHAEGSYQNLITFVTDRPGHDLRYAIDATKLENELGWRAEENFESGIRKTVEWYLNNDWWWRPIREAKYAGERLGQNVQGEKK